MKIIHVNCEAGLCPSAVMQENTMLNTVIEKVSKENYVQPQGNPSVSKNKRKLLWGPREESLCGGADGG